MPYGIDAEAFAAHTIAVASNVPGVNTGAFTLSDLVSVFPQFVASDIKTIAINSAGTGYHVDDVLTVVQTGASSGIAQVLSVSVTGGVTSVALRDGGVGYSTFNNLPTTVAPSGGSGCTLNIVSSMLDISPELTQMFIDMANSSLSESRWKSKWKFAMCLYVAHFLTLWLRTQNGSNATAAQVISTAQSLFNVSSKGVGDVSVSYDTSSISGSLPGWGMWTTTTYGSQLTQFAAFLPGVKAGMYIR